MQVFVANDNVQKPQDFKNGEHTTFMSDSNWTSLEVWINNTNEKYMTT